MTRTIILVPFIKILHEIAAPRAPALNTGRLFFDSADEHFKIKKSNATVVDLESAGVGGGGGGGGMAAGGTVQRSGDATTTVFTIAHGLSPIPELYWAEAASDDAISNRRTTVTSTDIVVTYAVPPPAGTQQSHISLGSRLYQRRFWWLYAIVYH